MTKLSLFFVSASVELRFNNAHVTRNNNPQPTVKLQRQFKETENNTKIFCQASQSNGTGIKNVTKTRNLTLILQLLNVTNVDEDFSDKNISKY